MNKKAVTVSGYVISAPQPRSFFFFFLPNEKSIHFPGYTYLESTVLPVCVSVRVCWGRGWPVRLS